MNRFIQSAFFMLVMLLFSCKDLIGPGVVKQEASTVLKMQEKQLLKVAIDVNSTDFFIKKGRPLGFQLEMVGHLSDYLGVKIEVIPEKNAKRRIELLKNGDVDIIASGNIQCNVMASGLDYIVPYAQSPLVIVKNIKDTLKLNHLAQLKGITVYKSKINSENDFNPFVGDVHNPLSIVYASYSSQMLLKMVQRGDIDYALCNLDLADKFKERSKGLDVAFELNSSQNLAWAIRPNDGDFKFLVDNWMKAYLKSSSYAYLVKKYHKNDRFNSIDSQQTFKGISPYDRLLKKHSKDLGYDWKLLASLIYQESRFNPNAQSQAGAYGVMQLMPRTGSRFGVTRNSSVEEQIYAGVQFLKWLDEQLSFIEDKEERAKFVFASYNCGLGHVLDARRLAESNGYNPNKWNSNVAGFILKKQLPEYYNRAEVKYGYCRGSETYKYVNEVFERYQHYSLLIAES